MQIIDVDEKVMLMMSLEELGAIHESVIIAQGFFTNTEQTNQTLKKVEDKINEFYTDLKGDYTLLKKGVNKNGQ